MQLLKKMKTFLPTSKQQVLGVINKCFETQSATELPGLNVALRDLQPKESTSGENEGAEHSHLKREKTKARKINT